MPGNVSLRAVDDVSVIDLTGKITIGEGVNALQETLDGLIAEGKNRILLNLTGVTYMDSLGLGTLAGLYVKTREAGGLMNVCAVPDKVQRLMSVTRLDGTIQAYPDEQAALADMAPAA